MTHWGTSLVAQWLRILPSMQGTRVRSLVREDSTCCGATKPVGRNYWTCVLEPASHKYWAREPQVLSPRATTTEACVPRARAPQREATGTRSPCTATKSSPCSPQLEKKPARSNEDPTQPKKKQKNKKDTLKFWHCKKKKKWHFS